MGMKRDAVMTDRIIVLRTLFLTHSGVEKMRNVTSLLNNRASANAIKNITMFPIIMRKQGTLAKAAEGEVQKQKIGVISSLNPQYPYNTRSRHRVIAIIADVIKKQLLVIWSKMIRFFTHCKVIMIKQGIIVKYPAIEKSRGNPLYITLIYSTSGVAVNTSEWYSIKSGFCKAKTTTNKKYVMMMFNIDCFIE